KHPFPSIDIFLNNPGQHHPQKSIQHITSHHLLPTFQTNIFPIFYLTKPLLPHLNKPTTIINTPSVTPYKPHQTLIHYSSTKAPLLTFTTSLSLSLIKQP
ncbi:SDR family NAD(P)-dependent oxidoreductase, partial [Bacillus altitudinis]|uniref:SDR family NAD(P)-dependent oxidoreductase n=1 Tax=Bacillus altitudinis TaxID=293387 RepID=UPI0011A680A1